MLMRAIPENVMPRALVLAERRLRSQSAVRLPAKVLKREVAVGVKMACTDAGDGDELEQRPVDCDGGDGERGDEDGAAGCFSVFARARDEEIDDGADEVADADALQHSGEAESVPVIVGEAVERDAEEDEDDAAAKNSQGELDAVGSVREARGERVWDGETDHEEERGEDHVGAGGAEPCGVLELGVGVSAPAGVFDEDHGSDDEAAEDIEGDKAGGCMAGSCRHFRPWELELQEDTFSIKRIDECHVHGDDKKSISQRGGVERKP
jgi:hypothetical protein